MNNELVHDYLESAGMEPAQAAALPRILGESATRNDVLLIDQRMESLEQRLELRMDGLEEKLNGRMDGLEEKLTRRMDGLEEKLTQRMDGLEQRLDHRMHSLEQGLRADMNAMKSELTWRLIALFVALAALTSALNHFMA